MLRLLARSGTSSLTDSSMPNSMSPVMATPRKTVTTSQGECLGAFRSQQGSPPTWRSPVPAHGRWVDECGLRQCLDQGVPSFGIQVVVVVMRGRRVEQLHPQPAHGSRHVLDGEPLGDFQQQRLAGVGEQPTADVAGVTVGVGADQVPAGLRG
jgi:hypothetical protein